MKFNELAAKAPKRPTRVITLSPGAFADTYSEKPEDDIAVGLRLLPELESTRASAQADQEAVRMARDPENAKAMLSEELRLEMRNDAFRRLVVGYAMCDPNDATVPYFALGDDILRIAMTPDGIRHVYEELIFTHASRALGMPRATDDDVAQLARILLDGGALNALPHEQADDLRRVLTNCLGQLLATGRAAEKPTERQGYELHLID